AMVERNASVPEDLQIKYRIGINLGEIIVDGEDIYGDGVNIAARLEGLAAPGGIYISGKVYEEVRNKVPTVFEDLGKQEVKNIPEPVRVYRIRLGEATGAGASGSGDAPPLPDKPSIAVLSFDNMSGDPEQEYFADGIAEDIITVLSRFHWFFVIARNSSFTYKGSAVDVTRVAKELGVRYVLEGSVRKAGNRVRISAQMIDATTGQHVWAERYDRDLADIFAVQEEIAESIAGSIGPEYLAAEARRAQRKDARNLNAWDLVMRARWHLWRLTRQDNPEAQRLLREAIELDPGNVMALSDFAFSQMVDSAFGWSEAPGQSLSEAAAAARKAIAIDERDAWAHTVLGMIDRYALRYDDSIRRLEKAIDLNPNLAHAHNALGFTLAYAGEYDAAISSIGKAIRLSPRDSFKFIWFEARAVAAFGAGRYRDAVEWARKSIQENPQFPGGYRVLAAAHGQLGERAEARAALEAFLRLQPSHTVDDIKRHTPWKKPADMARYLDGLRKAGLPE
ncbi:MAG: adenylate/guanylate cyclase domain-containing protein, partial [Kiloniellales bacterium]